MKLYHFDSLCPSSARGWESQFKVDRVSSRSLPLPYFMCVNVCACAYAGPCCFSTLFLEKQVALQAYVEFYVSPGDVSSGPRLCAPST